MATDQDKYANRARLWGMVVVAMTTGIWDMVEESSVTLSPLIGASLLSLLEKNAGLEIAGEKPEHMLVELGRILVDEFGYATEAKVEGSDKSYKLTLVNAVGLPEFKALETKGITKAFSNPVYCTGVAAMARLGYKCRAKVDINLETKTQVTTFELL
jgi:hypothetical protein